MTGIIEKEHRKNLIAALIKESLELSNDLDIMKKYKINCLSYIYLENYLADFQGVITYLKGFE